MVCANAGYLLSNPSTGVRLANCFYSSTEKSSAQRFEIKTKDMGTTPHKAILANCFYSSTEKSSAQRFEIKTKDMGTTPHKAMRVGSLTTIHRASNCLPQVVWYLQCIQKTNMNA